MRFLIPVFLSLMALAGCNREVPIRAEVIYTGGTIYTGVSEGETVEAVAVGEGLIIYAGDLETAMRLSRDGSEIINIGDAFMYPGFTDAHVHLAGVGERELSLNLDSAASIEDLKTKLSVYRQENPDLEAIIGRGWIETHWPEGRFPTASDLDEVVSDIPVALIRADGHALVANTAAMTASNINTETTAPEGGSILRDDDGVPNGMFIDLAMNLLNPVFAEKTDTQTRLAVERGYQVYAARGWTGIHNMSVDEQQLDVLADLAVHGEAPLRTYNAVVPDLIDRAINRSPDGDLITTRAVKLYVDGALGSRGALLFAPYSDATGTTGLQLISQADAKAIFDKAVSGNVQIAMHAIGDRGNSLVLDWMDEAFEDLGEDADPRWRIEHAQIVRPQDQDRFAELGVIASMQPSHAIGDLYFAPSRLGDDRLEGAYAWKSLLDKGVVIAGGSDAPVEVGDPIIEFYAATVRKGLKDGYTDENWHPEQALSRFKALQIFTRNPAYASFQDEKLGTIETGNYADFTVFNQDILTVPDEELLNTRPVMTIVAGKQVWSAD